MLVERRGRVIAFEIGSTGNGRNPIFNGRRQPSRGGTSRMMREYQVRICERLGVKFPGPTRQTRLPYPRSYVSLRRVSDMRTPADVPEPRWRLQHGPPGEIRGGFHLPMSFRGGFPPTYSRYRA